MDSSYDQKPHGLPSLNKLRLTPQSRGTRKRLQNLIRAKSAGRKRSASRGGLNQRSSRPSTVESFGSSSMLLFEETSTVSTMHESVDGFITWVQEDWKNGYETKAYEATKYAKKRSIQTRIANAIAGGLNGDDPLLASMESFENFMTNDWPSLRFMKCYENTGVEALSDECAQYGRRLRQHLIEGFHRDLRKELSGRYEPCHLESGVMINVHTRKKLRIKQPSNVCQIKLLSRWFDLTMDTIGNLGGSTSPTTSGKKIKGKIARHQLTAIADDLVDPSRPDRKDIEPEEAAALRIWKPNKMVAIAVCFHEIMDKVNKYDKTLGGLLQQLWLNLLRTMHTEMSSSEARCKRAEKLALETDRAMRALQKAKAGWSVMRKARHGMAAMRSLNSRVLQRKQSAQEERIKMIGSLSKEERLDIIRKSLSDKERRLIALEFLADDLNLIGGASFQLQEDLARKLISHSTRIINQVIDEDPMAVISNTSRMTRQLILGNLLQENPKKGLAAHLHKLGGSPEEIAGILDHAVSASPHGTMEWQNAINEALQTRLLKRTRGDEIAAWIAENSGNVDLLKATPGGKANFDSLMAALIDAQTSDADPAFQGKLEKIAQCLGQSGLDKFFSTEASKDYFDSDRGDSKAFERLLESISKEVDSTRAERLAASLEQSGMMGNILDSASAKKIKSQKSSSSATQTSESDFASDSKSRNGIIEQDSASTKRSKRVSMAADVYGTDTPKNSDVVPEIEDPVVVQEMNRRKNSEQSGNGRRQRMKRRRGTVFSKSKRSLGNEDPIGMSVMLWVQNGKRRPKKPKVVTLKTLMQMIDELIHAKTTQGFHLDSNGLPIHEPFPEFIRDCYLIKYGKNDKAHVLTLKRMEQLAASIEYHHDAHPRVRNFARACGINTCCRGGICGCMVPELDISEEETGSKKKWKIRKSIRFAPSFGDIYIEGVLQGFKLSRTVTNDEGEVVKGTSAEGKFSNENSSSVDNLIKLLANDGKESKATLVFQSRMMNFAADTIPGLKDDGEMIERIRKSFSHTTGYKIDGAGKEKIDLDAALEIILGTKIAEEKQMHIAEMKKAVLKIEKLVIGRRARRHAHYLSTNIRLVLEREALKGLYTANDLGADGCHSLSEFSDMMAAIDPSLSPSKINDIFMEEVLYLKEKKRQLDGYDDEDDQEEKAYEDNDDVDLASEFSDSEESGELKDGSSGEDDSMAISSEAFVQLIWRLGYILNSATKKWKKE